MHRLWVTLCLLLLSPILLVVAGGGDIAFNKPQIRLTTTFLDFDARIMDHWGNGGGKNGNIPRNARHPFPGRAFGGGKRKDIRGTRAFGSGYPYGTVNRSTIARRPFPYGVWPLYWDQNFMDADEYGPKYDAFRPGGFVASVPLRTTTEHFNVTDEEVYYAIGDRESLLFLMISFVTECHVTPAWPSRFDPSSPNAPIKLENVIQYFRASSFALASPAYNNTFARTPSRFDTMKNSTRLSEFMEYSPFRKCVDGVTENALAIMNPPPGRTELDEFVRALMYAGVFIVIGILLFLAYAYRVVHHLRSRFQRWLYGDRERVRLARPERENELLYESYP